MILSIIYISGSGKIPRLESCRIWPIIDSGANSQAMALSVSSRSEFESDSNFFYDEFCDDLELWAESRLSDLPESEELKSALFIWDIGTRPPSFLMSSALS